MPKRISAAAGACRGSCTNAAISRDHVPCRRTEIEIDARCRHRARRRRARARAPPPKRSSPKPLALTEPAKTSISPVAPFSRSSQRLGIGGRRIGMIDALHQLSRRRRGRGRRWSARRPRAHRAARWSGRHRSALKPLKWRALEHARRPARRQSSWVAAGKSAASGRGSGLSSSAKCHAWPGRANTLCRCNCRAEVEAYGGGSFSMPLASIRSSASRTRMPAIMRSGAISASGTSTKARSNRRGCGSVSSGSS